MRSSKSKSLSPKNHPGIFLIPPTIAPIIAKNSPPNWVRFIAWSLHHGEAGLHEHHQGTSHNQPSLGDPPPLRGPLPPKPASHFLRWGVPLSENQNPHLVPQVQPISVKPSTITANKMKKKTLAKLQHLAHTALQSWQHTTSHDPVFPAPIPPVVAGSDNALFPRDCWRVCVLFPCISSRFPRRL